jgi:hypothetical protein
MTLFSEIIPVLRLMAQDAGMDKKFEKYVKDISRDPKADLVYYLAYDLDACKFVINSDFDIPFNTIVLKKATVHSKKEAKKLEPTIQDYIYKWEKVKT